MAIAVIGALAPHPSLLAQGGGRTTGVLSRSKRSGFPTAKAMGRPTFFSEPRPSCMAAPVTKRSALACENRSLAVAALTGEYPSYTRSWKIARCRHCLSSAKVMFQAQEPDFVLIDNNISNLGMA
jgi:hypothetical protein